MFKLVSFLSIFLLSACSTNKQLINSQAVKVTIISPIIKISDVGFLHMYKNGWELQIYNSANALAYIRSIKSGRKCINSACFDNTEFNKKFLLLPHYETILDDIIHKKPIYDGQNLTKSDCGFYQNISKLLVAYSVCNKDIKFVDNKNRIKIEIKELK